VPQPLCQQICRLSCRPVSKSDIRGKETEINALRDGVLSGRSQRQALLDKRRIEAVERVWSSIIALGPYKGVSGMMSVMNFEVVEKRVPHDPKLRSYFSMLIANIPEPDINGPESAAYRDRPFLSPLAWADFSAYSTVVMGGYAYAKLFGLGIEDAGRTLSHDAIREVLRATLPYRSDYIDQLGKLQFNLLLDDLERELLAELGNMLSGVDSDQASIARAAEITRAVKNAVDEADTNKAKNVDLA
jgi:hypothetical protein